MDVCIVKQVELNNYVDNLFSEINNVETQITGVNSSTLVIVTDKTSIYDIEHLFSGFESSL